jgi:hypothetical protein
MNSGQLVPLFGPVLPARSLGPLSRLSIVFDLYWDVDLPDRKLKPVLWADS